MSSFLYFSEELTHPVQLADCQRLGLGYAFDANPASMEITGRTPTGGKGWLFFDGKRIGNAFQGYKAEFQQWRKIPNSEVWVGFDTAKRPTPESLARNERLSSILFALEDGNEWAIPKLSYYSGENGFVSSLVRYVALDESGEWVPGRVKGGHNNLVELGDRLAAAMVYRLVDETIPELTFSEASESIASLLQANYFMSGPEVSLLELLSEDTILEACKQVVDFPTAHEFLLKKNGIIAG